MSERKASFFSELKRRHVDKGRARICGRRVAAD